jgi:hypothetical protein
MTLALFRHLCQKLASPPPVPQPKNEIVLVTRATIVHSRDLMAWPDRVLNGKQ